ncbi:MAG: nucleoside 2-deoxyribosyltransferase [Pseudomonadota bacterium]
MAAQRTLYFAGDIFDHKDLIGNALLADYIESVSEQRYRCVLPQALEQSTHRSVAIRNQDLLAVMRSDVALFNFDGDDLDSGTVVEFMLAKMLDIPAVILRTDFRSAGDQTKDGDPWNLMCSFYPRTTQVTLNAMAWFQSGRDQDQPVAEALEGLYQPLAKEVVSALDEACAQTPLMSQHLGQATKLYEWAKTFPGSGLPAELASGEIDALIKRKHNAGLID